MVPYFAVFVVAWTYLRHYINLKIIFSFLPYVSLGWNPHPLVNPGTQPLYSIPAGFLSGGDPDRAAIHIWPSQFSSIGPYKLNWDTQQYKCYISQPITFVLLTALQSVNIFWLYLILRIAYRLVRNGEKRDDRSDDEDETTETGETDERAADAPARREPTITPPAAKLDAPAAHGRIAEESDAGSASETGRSLRRSPRKRKV